MSAGNLFHRGRKNKHRCKVDQMCFKLRVKTEAVTDGTNTLCGFGSVVE